MNLPRSHPRSFFLLKHLGFFPELWTSSRIIIPFEEQLPATTLSLFSCFIVAVVVVVVVVVVFFFPLH